MSEEPRKPKKVVFTFDEWSLVEPDFDNMPSEQVDELLRGYGYDPEEVRKHNKGFMRVLFENLSLRADLDAVQKAMAFLGAKDTESIRENERLKLLNADRNRLFARNDELERLLSQYMALSDKQRERLRLAEAVCEVAETLSEQCWHADVEGDLSEFVDGNVMIDTIQKIKVWHELKEAKP